VFYGDKAIDRSPCGTGTSARMAQLAAKGRLKPGDDFVHESIIGSLFRGRVEAAAAVGGRAAIIPSVAGWARVTGVQHHLHRRSRSLRARFRGEMNAPDAMG
jgi:4-hydroxyproline epimerase